jgi:hypothetical protein
VFVIPAAGGAPVQVGKDLASAGDVVWSPDGKAVLAYGRRSITGPDTAPDWWWIPIDGGASVATGVYARLQASGIEIDVTDIQPYPGSWMDGLWRVPVDRRSGRVTGSPVQVTNDTTIDAFPSVARDGRMVFAAQSSAELLFGMPLDASAGRPLGPLRNLREDATPSQRSSISADGQLLAFPKYDFASGSLWVRALRTGQERQLAATPRTPLNPVISVDGRWVAYTVTAVDTGGNGGPGAGYIVESTGGIARKVCDSCQIATWTRDNQQVILTVQNEGFVRLDVRTGARTPLITTKRTIDRPMFGPSGRWLTFNVAGGVQLAPVHSDRPAGEDEWTTILKANGSTERTAGMAPNGQLLYVLLERDGFRCLYALKIDPGTGRPSGDPFIVTHFHDASRRWGSTGLGSAVASNLFVVSLHETTSNIWMTTLGSAR